MGCTKCLFLFNLHVETTVATTYDSKIASPQEGLQQELLLWEREIPAMYDVAVSDPQANAVLHNTTHNLYN